MKSDNTLPLSSDFNFSESTDCRDTGSRNHAHTQLEIVIYTYGSGTCLINDTLYQIRSGDIVFIPSHHIHKTTYTSDYHSRFCILLSDAFIPPYAKELLVSNHYVYRNPKAFSIVCSIVNGIAAEYTYQDRLCSHMLTSYIHLFFSTLCRNQNFYNYERNGTTVFAEKILDHIKKNFQTDITLAATATQYSISPQYLSGIFKKETGMNFNEYINTVRLNHAEQLLKQQKGNSISEIAYSCGFNDSNYFSHRFKQAFGISPLQFSKIYQSKNN